MQELSRLSKAFKNEWIKTTSNKFPYLGLVLSATLPFFASAGFKRIGADHELNGLAYLSNSAQLALTSIIPLFTLVHTSLLIITETTQGTYRDALSRPLARWEFLLSKLMVGLLYPIILLAANIGMGLIVAAWKYNLGAIKENDVILVSSAKMAASLLMAGGLSLLPLFALLSFGFFISTISRTFSGAVGFTLGIYIGLEPFKFLIRIGETSLDRYVVSTYLDAPFGIVKDLAAGIDITWNTPDIHRCVIVSLVYIIIFTGLSFLIFQKQDLNK